jgi:hypothetical protein
MEFETVQKQGLTDAAEPQQNGQYYHVPFPIPDHKAAIHLKYRQGQSAVKEAFTMKKSAVSVTVT